MGGGQGVLGQCRRRGQGVLGQCRFVGPDKVAALAVDFTVN